MLGFLGLGFLWWMVRGATPGVPGKRQAFVEFLIGSSTTRSKASFITVIAIASSPRGTHGLRLGRADERDDFLPADLVGLVTHHFSEHGFRYVPTADVNTTFALALTVWLLMIGFSIASKGLGGWIHELFCAPFGTKSAAVASELPVQLGRVRVEAAVAFAAAVRQHVCG